jgi:hypothetical protein
LRRRTPQHAHTLVGRARPGLWSLFLAPDLAMTLRPCRPRRHGLAVEACFVHAIAEKGTPSFWSTSAHLATGRRSHTRASVPDCGYLVRRHPLAPARAPPQSSPPHRFMANSGPKPELLTPLRPCAPKRTHTHARSHASSPERAPRPRCLVPPPRRHRRADHGVGLAAPVASFLGRFLRTLATRGDPVNLAEGHVAQVS